MRKFFSWLLAGRKPAASHLLLAPAALWLIVFLVLPAAGLVALSFAKNGPYGQVIWSLGLQNYRRAFDPKYIPVLIRTVCFAGATTALCLLLGYPLAYFLSFRAGKWRNVMIIGLMVPFWTSALVAFYSWMVILGKEGLMNSALLRFGFISSPLGVLYTPFSVLLGLVYFYLPFTVLPLYSSLEKVPRSYVEAAYDLGAGRWTAFIKVTFPLSLPGVIAGALLTFVPCLGDFLTAEILGGPRYYLLGNLISNQFLMAQDWPFGAALTSLLLLGLVGGLWAYRKWEADALKKGRGMALYCSALYAFLYIPLVVMTVFSFNDAHRNVVWRGFTVKWYAALFHDAELMNAMLTSLELAAAAAAIATALGLLASYALVRHKPFKGRGGYAALLDAPLMMPEVALGVGLLSFLVRMGYELDFGALACAHALICLPYTIGALRARLKSSGGAQLEEAALDLGATEWTAFLKVTLPLLAPAIVSGSLLAFTVSFEDFVTSFFLAGIGIVTLPIKVYSMMKFGVTPEINALSVVLLGTTFLLLGLNALFSSRAGDSARA